MPDENLGVYRTATAAQPAGEPAGTEPEPEAIRQELARVLGSAAFRNSKRYSALLQHLVNRSLEGRSAELKERAIGVEIFRRAADYDVSKDHIVRSSCSEIRKRLAQHYLGSGSEGGMRIDLLPGSYVPQFRVFSEEAGEGTPVPAEAGTGETRLASGWAASRVRRWLVGGVVLLAAAGLGAVGGAGWRGWHTETALDRFWRPLVEQRGSILLCVGKDRRTFGAGRAEAAAAPETASSERARASIPGDDAITLARLAGELEKRGKEFRVFLGSSATFEDVKERSAVLIGAKSNEWTLQALNSLRFRLENPDGPAESYISDTKGGAAGNTWTPAPDTVRGEYTRDYAIVARCVSPQTRKLVVIAAGVHAYGTLAAGDFLTSEELMAQLEARAPKGWERKNVEAVLATEVIGGVGGPPSIVAAYFW